MRNMTRESSNESKSTVHFNRIILAVIFHVLFGCVPSAPVMPDTTLTDAATSLDPDAFMSDTDGNAPDAVSRKRRCIRRHVGRTWVSRAI